MSSSHRCYIPSFVEIGPPVPEKKIFEGFLPYMGVAAILVMWPRCHEQTFVPPTHRGSTQNLALIGQAVSEEKMFEIVDADGRTYDGRTPEQGYTKSSPMSLRLRWANKYISTYMSHIRSTVLERSVMNYRGRGLSMFYL